jgi:hypothetical protein
MKSIISLLALTVPLSIVADAFLSPRVSASFNHMQAVTYLASTLSFAETESPRTLIRQGMQSFRDGDVSSSLALFDRADAAVPDGSLRPYLWQRGISYYYLDMFEAGSDQVSLGCNSCTACFLMIRLTVNSFSLCMYSFD